MIGTGALRALVGAGLSPQQILAVAEAIEADARPKDRSAAERQARRRERLKAGRAETGEAAPAVHVGIPGVRAGVTHPVTDGVTGRVTKTVTRDSSPLDENISNPPGSTQTPDGVSPSKPRRAGRLPDDFVMPEEWKLWARAQRGWAAETIATEAENFADYWQARATGATKRDWRKAWQNWVRNSKRPDGPHRETRALSPAEQAQSAEQKAQAAADYAARLERIGRAEDAALVRRRWATGPPRAVGECLPAAIRSAGEAKGEGDIYRDGRA